MTIPWPDGRPDQQVGQDSGQQLSQGFQVMVGQLRSLERVISTQTAMMERTINAASRYQMAGQPQLRQDVLQSVAGSGGSLHGTRQTQVSTMGALSSMENLQAFGAQRFGQWIAGMPLYEQPGGGQGGGGATPAGTPNSQTGAGLPAQSPQTQPGAGGQPSPGGGPPSGPPGGGPPPPPGPSSGGGPPAGQPASPQGLQGLPALLYGNGTRQQLSGPQQMTLATLQQVGARVAMSGGGLSSVGNVLRDLPGVGVAMDAIQGGANFYLKQREAGRVYQSFEGGSNLGAQTERLHQAGYQLSMFGRMPEGAAAQAFGAVSAMGYNQANPSESGDMQNRQSALDFVYHNYTSSGMDVNQSLQVLQTASQSAVVNLQQLSTALKTVSDDAGQAGTNADQARQQFNSYFNAALGQGAGNGATAVAGGIASMQADMGKSFSGVNFSPELSQARQYMLSGMSGVSPADLQYIQRNNPGQYNQMLASQNMQFLQGNGLMTGQMQSGLQQMIKAAGGASALKGNSAMTAQIAQQFLNKYQVSGQINENQWTSEINGLTGLNMTANQAFQWMVTQSAGINEASNNSKLTQSLTGKNAPTGKYGLAVASPDVMGSIAAAKNGPSGTTGGTWQQTLANANGAAAQPYLSQEKKTGQRNPVLEALLQNTSSSDQVRVQTKTGARVMSMADAMKYYPNELQAGQVEFYNKSGKAIGDTSSITHGLINAGASVTGEEEAKAGSNKGVTASKYNSSHSGSQQVGSGKSSVTVSLSSEAQQLLKLLPTNSDTAAASSQVPANYYTSQASR
jgi:hypothetical protein